MAPPWHGFGVDPFRFIQEKNLLLEGQLGGEPSPGPVVWGSLSWFWEAREPQPLQWHRWGRSSWEGTGENHRDSPPTISEITKQGCSSARGTWKGWRWWPAPAPRAEVSPSLPEIPGRAGTSGTSEGAVTAQAADSVKSSRSHSLPSLPASPRAVRAQLRPQHLDRFVYLWFHDYS